MKGRIEGVEKEQRRVRFVCEDVCGYAHTRERGSNVHEPMARSESAPVRTIVHINDEVKHKPNKIRIHNDTIDNGKDECRRVKRHAVHISKMEKKEHKKWENGVVGSERKDDVIEEKREKRRRAIEFGEGFAECVVFDGYVCVTFVPFRLVGETQRPLLNLGLNHRRMSREDSLREVNEYTEREEHKQTRKDTVDGARVDGSGCLFCTEREI